MKKMYDVFIDSGAFVGLYLKHDPHHSRSISLFNYVIDQKINVVTSNLVIAEVATVLSHKRNQDISQKFIKIMEIHPTIFVAEQLFNESLSFFSTQTKKGTSFVDACNVSLMNTYNISRIFSFDKAYSKQYGVKMLIDDV